MPESSKRRALAPQMEPGVARLEDPENDDAWIEVEYREGWWRRKLLTDDKSAYEEMVFPFYLKCRACHIFESPELWSYNSPYCPGCEMRFSYAVPRFFERVFDGDETDPSGDPAVEDI